MDYQLKNNFLTVTLSDQGAEIQSVKDVNNGQKCIWQADPKIWDRHAPVLFPVIGCLRDDRYTYDDETYHMGQHGFTRDSRFTVEEQDDKHIVFLLTSNEDTKKMYPFDFELRVTYSLVNNLLPEHFTVASTSAKKMIFGIGGHPGSNLPTDNGLTKDDYYFKFTPSMDHVKIPLKAPYLDWDNCSLLVTDSLFEISDESFKNDAWAFELKQPNKTSIRTDKGDYHISAKTENASSVGLWSQYFKSGNCVCIEPWWGIADALNSDGQLGHKRGINHIALNEVWENGFTMVFHNKVE